MIETKGHELKNITGDLAVSGNVEVGRDVDIHGKARVAGSLKVEGFLDALHIKGSEKGLFNSVEDLKKEYPNPRKGWFAIVLDAEDKEKGILYIAENGQWVATADEAKQYQFIMDSINVYASKGELVDARTDIESKALKANTVIATPTDSVVEIKGQTISGAAEMDVCIPSATETEAGVMSAEDKKTLTKNVTWDNENSRSNMNDFTTAGVYNITGQHTRTDDNLPIINTGGGHTFHARLTVLDSSISGTGNTDDKCITQILSFNNRLGQGEVYIRTGKGDSLDNLTWEKWSTLQRNVNVERVSSLDDFIDNGIYSGVLLSTGEMFILVVINNYALVGQGALKSISQFKYSVTVTGEALFAKRVKVADWDDWEILNLKEITSMIDDAVNDVLVNVNDRIKDAVKDIIEGVDPEKIDSIKDIAAWIEAHGGDVTAIYNAINANTTKITAEINRAKGEEQKLNTAIAEEAARAKNKENDLAAAINTGLNDLGTEFTEADNLIKGNAMQYNTLGVNVYADKAEIYGRSIDGNPKTVDIPAATPTKAGVMTANDKVALDNVDKKINQAVADIVDSAPESFDTLKEVATWIEDDKTGAAAMAQAISDNTKTINEEKERSLTADTELINAINKEAERVDNKMAQAKTELVNGDVIVGQSREVYSRTGKSDNATFLKRTTAGGTSIGGGVATLKQVGGNIVKNIAGVIENTIEVNASLVPIGDNFFKYTKKAVAQTYLMHHIDGFINGHQYYISYYNYCNTSTRAIVSLAYGWSDSRVIYLNSTGVDTWGHVSKIATFAKGDLAVNATTTWWPLGTGTGAVDDYCIFSKPIYIDLTEMFGAGNEPTKEECDKLFGTMDALPMGLTVANPTSFKSVGYNQANPANILVGKGIAAGAIVDKADSNIAVIECLPCKIGVGENNGYCIHGDFAEGEEVVYLSPLNPVTTDGELYMHQLTRNDDKGTYVPQIKGYMLVEVPRVTNLCVHFLWSEDWDRHDYEPYHESVVALPNIPEMSEWGLAGLCSNVGANAVYDTIDLENSRYTRRIGSLKIKELRWGTGIATANGVSYRYYYTPDKIMQINAKCLLEGYVKVKQEALSVKELENMTFMAYDTGRIYLRNDNCSTINDFLASEGEKRVFYELITPEEYPIVVTDKNYISSDYGTEEFDAKIPLNANNLYYQRSLVGETRNFLDRLMAGLGTDDVTAIADRIVTALSPAAVNNDMIEE